MHVDLLKQCWFLAGPTAVGKTLLSLRLAEELNAEVLSLDSMAIYRGMDIGTAKPSAEERQRVPHHLIDLADPHQEFSVADYVEAASRAVADILVRDRVPLFVGGTGLYLRSLLRGLFNGPESDPAIRARWQQGLEEEGELWLHAQLAEVDEVTAERLHPNDTRRVIRAIEVFEVTGQPMSQQQQQPARPVEDRPVALWLEPDRAWLRERIDRRVDDMMAAGLLDEVRQLMASPGSLGRTAAQALGYRELLAHLNGDVPLEKAIEQIKTGTRQFAKRQHTWFRNLEECEAVPVTATDTADTLLAKTLEAARR